MRAVLNLATRPFLNYRPFLVTAGALAGLALVLSLLVGVASLGAWQERTRVRARLGELRDQHARLLAEQQQLEAALLQPSTQQRLQRVQFLNQMIGRKVFSWTQLFLDLEERLPEQARILALVPSLREDGRLQVELRVGANSVEAVIRLLQSLEEGEKFSQVTLHSQTTESGSERDPRLAQISAVYSPK